MANKQSGSDHHTGNGSNTAIYIHSYKSGANSEEDLKYLADQCFKSNVPLTLYADSKLSSKLPDEYQNSDKVKLLQSDELSDDIKNVIPVQIPLATDGTAFLRWAASANKVYNGTNMVAANGQFGKGAALTEKISGYFSNFWNKLFTGANANLAGIEAVVLSVDDFKQLVISKKIKNSWQLAALAEKAGSLNKLKFEYPKNSFVLGEGFKELVKGKLGGFQALFNSFIKAPGYKSESSHFSNPNAPIYKKTFGIFAALLLVVMCFISFDYNITWDEPNHNNFSKDVLKYYSSFGNDTTMFDFTKAGHRDYVSNVYYGMSIDVFAAAVNTILDIKNEFATRHLVNAIVGFFSILFAALIVRLFGGWLPATLTLLVMICSPSYFGHCFNNPKDIPFAAGYIMALYYLLKLLREMPKAKHQTKVMIAIAIGFALSIRAGGLLLFGYLGMTIFFWLLFMNKGGNKKENPILSAAKVFLLVGIGGYIIGISMWPYALRQPLTGAITALREFEKFGFLTYYELFEGTRQYLKPWYYELKLIGITAPLSVLFGLVPLLILWLFKSQKDEKLMILILVIATAFPLFYAIYKKSYVYNGWRHFLFIYPSLAALGIIGWNRLILLFKGKMTAPIIYGIIGLYSFSPGIWSIANHPYQYMYFNELTGGIKGANGIYELDYWNQTPREAFDWLVKNHPEVCKGNIQVNSNNIQESLKTFVKGGDSVRYVWTREYEWMDNKWEYAIWTTRTLSKNQILDGYWPPKGTIHTVDVGGVPVAAVVKAPNLNSYLGKQALKRQDYDSAIWYYSNCLKWNPLEEEYARGLADACMGGKRLDSAERFYKEAIRLRDGNYEALQGLGTVYYQKAFAMNPNSPDRELMNKALESFKSTYRYKKNASAPLFAGQILMMEEKPLDAMNYFHAFLQSYGNAPEGYLWLAKSQLASGVQADSAMFNLQVSMQLNPKNPEPAQLLYDQLIQQGRKEEAEQFMKQYQQLNNSAQ